MAQKKLGDFVEKAHPPPIKPKLLQTLSTFRVEKSSKVRLPIFQPLKMIIVCTIDLIFSSKLGLLHIKVNKKEY